jgi:hypothetical protein
MIMEHTIESEAHDDFIPDMISKIVKIHSDNDNGDLTVFILAFNRLHASDLLKKIRSNLKGLEFTFSEQHSKISFNGVVIFIKYKFGGDAQSRLQGMKIKSCCIVEYVRVSGKEHLDMLGLAMVIKEAVSSGSKFSRIYIDEKFRRPRVVDRLGSAVADMVEKRTTALRKTSAVWGSLPENHEKPQR